MPGVNLGHLEGVFRVYLDYYGIYLYVLEKPSFVIDEYTKRFVNKGGLANKFDYDYLKDLFEKNLPREVKIYQNYHALIIIEQRGKKAARMEII